MRFHGIMLLRDEADIIAQTFDHVLGWIDSLYILDMGSVDGTWEIVQDYARRDRRVVPFCSKPYIYGDNLRAIVFDQYRQKFSAGDWVGKIDADEFYQLPPPEFVRQRLGRVDTAVHLQWYFFRLTRQEADDYLSGKVNLTDDRKRPIADRRRHYKISTYAEPRMFKYRRSMRWPQDANFPFNAGFVARQRIPIRHYPHRDPAQMQGRFRLRAAMMKLGAATGAGHWRLEDWRKDVVDDAGRSAAAELPQKVGLAGEAGVDTGPLLYWKPGTELPEEPLFNHVPPPRVRLAQRIVHPLLLPILDRTRAAYDRSYQPKLLPAELAKGMYD